MTASTWLIFSYAQELDEVERNGQEKAQWRKITAPRIPYVSCGFFKARDLHSFCIYGSHTFVVPPIMVLPSSISEASPLDPLLLLPFPKHLPPSPSPDLEPLFTLLEPHLSPSPTSSTPTIPISILTAHMRQITRRAQVLLNVARVGAAEAREGLDKVDVDLRGVEYERDRVREEIERCEDYA